MAELVYLYAILPADAVAGLEAQVLTGIDGGAVSLLTEGPLAAAVSPVAEEAFSAAALDANVRDLVWLGPRAAAHEAVNERLFAASAALLPLAFGTVYRDRAGVTRLLRAEQASLRKRLARVRGRGEWVLTIQRDPAAALAALDARSEVLTRLRDQLASATPGRAYLVQRQIEQARRSELLRLDAEAVRAILGALEPLAVQTYPEAIAADAGGTTLARLSLLVERARESAWAAATDEAMATWGAAGYTLRVTGPWPPYRFCALPESTANATQ